MIVEHMLFKVNFEYGWLDYTLATSTLARFRWKVTNLL